MTTHEITLSIPLQVSVRLGPPDPAETAGVVDSIRVAPEIAPAGLEAARPLDYYTGYIGYAADFLGTPVPLPTLSSEQRQNAAENVLATDGADPAVLPYTHFSLVMNRRRQLAYYTAVNIDGAQSEKLERGRDKWYFDPRIAESEQIGEGLYARNALDRGHLVRRLDPVWGPQARRGNDDTFHFTNCSPQHERFNQSDELWQGLEDYILEHADAEERKVTVFTGPVLGEQDPLYKGVRLPLAFWKILVYLKGRNGLAAAGYLLDQTRLIEDMLGREAAFDAGVYRVRLSHLVGSTGLDFAHLQAHELPLASGGWETAPERVRIHEDFSNVVL
ncbi:DNA/RNA non-specific endonuclease [Pseudonocardia sp. NPDC049154]|uniref:DNA/RNA non-specific endonuclease n=1 Tax=Pseudonocardia sp. NPDC049154 TaxID=3155501 RepID=UPI0033DCB7EA